MGLPPWAFGLLTIIGVAAGGSGAGFLGGTQAAKDIEALEEKVDKLDEKMDALREAIIRAHPETP
jgi:outer membrane murein-binding lipoprotein Lpp